jgi:anti-anti-sigma factor
LIIRNQGLAAVNIPARTIGDVVVFDIAGDLTRASSGTPTLHDLAKARLGMGDRKILFNFEKVNFVDSFGVGQICATYASTQNLGGGFKLCNVPQKLLLVLTVVGLVPRVIKAYPSEEVALLSFNKPFEPGNDSSQER